HGRGRGRRRAPRPPDRNVGNRERPVLPAVWRATDAALRRDLDLAEASANEALEVGRSAARGPEGVTAVWSAQIFAVRLFDGRLAELRELVDASADAAPSRPIWRAAAAF